MTAAIATPDRLRVGADEIIILAASAETAGALFAFEVHMEPGGGPPTMHRHAPSELYAILEGELTFYVADDSGDVRRTTASEGAAVPIAGGRAHTIRNESRAPARASVVFAPGEPMERFVRAAAGLAENGVPELEDVLELAVRHGIEMTGPIPRSCS